MRIIASMTTIPSRIAEIEPVIESVLHQTWLSIVWRSIFRSIASAMEKNTFFRIGSFRKVRSRFFEPMIMAITKIAPTLLRHRHDDAYIWSVDDDCRYPRNQLRLLTSISGPNEDRILTVMEAT